MDEQQALAQADQLASDARKRVQQAGY
jgi:hypothetical protein